MGGTDGMAGTDLADRDGLIDLLRSRTGHLGLIVSRRSVWADVDGPGVATPAQGWKIHVSARPVTLAATLDLVLPVILADPCRFKVIGSTGLLRDLNSAQNHPGAVGKALTIYPTPDRFTALAEELAAALVGMDGPGILSDRQVRSDSPVYYRYGPFRASYRVTANGDFELAVVDGNGDRHPAAAGTCYVAPGWRADPFGTDGRSGVDGAEVPTGVLLGGRYQVDEGVIRSAKGGVFRAADVSTGRRVVVKEARQHVHELVDGMDARTRLRNERRILELLHDLDQVPRVVDHFRHGGSEFLVTSDMGGQNLRQEVADHGPYRDTAHRNLRRLAGDLVHLLDAVHGRGVLVRDLSPKNIVLGAGDRISRISLVDFEISYTEPGPLFFGWTPGYSPADQERHQPATREGDYHALGATLYFAATGMDPVWLTDHAGNHDTGRIAASLAANLSDPPLVSVVIGLLDSDPAVRAGAAAALRAGHPTTPAAAPGRAAARTEEFGDLDQGELDGVIAHLCGQVARHARDLMAGTPLRGGGFVSPTNVYHGSAGMGAELLWHLRAPDIRDLATGIAYWTAGFATLRDLPPGLLVGGTGTAGYLALAGRALADDHLLHLARQSARPAPHQVSRDDYSHGLAGTGTAHLLIGALTGDPARTEDAARCAERFRSGQFLRALRDTHPDYADCGEVSRTLGFAHGLAGIAHFLLRYRLASADPGVDALVEDSFRELAEHVPALVHAAGQPGARPMHASFCQGLAGIGTALVRAAAPLGEDKYLALAHDSAAAGLDLATRMPVVSQCCGLAGLGEFVLDLAVATGVAEHRAQATRVARLMLLRAAGPSAAPTFADHTVIGTGGGWATGTAGILSFLRRLADPTTPRLWVGDEVTCRPQTAGRRPAGAPHHPEDGSQDTRPRDPVLRSRPR